MSFLNVNTPDTVIPAFEKGKGIFEISFSSDCKRLEVSVSSDKQHGKEFAGSELSSGKVTFDVSRCVQNFSFLPKDIYNNTALLTDSALRRSYNVLIEAEFESETKTFSFGGIALCSIYFDNEGGSWVDPNPPGTSVLIIANWGSPVCVLAENREPADIDATWSSPVCVLGENLLYVDFTWTDEVCTLADPKGVLNADLSWTDEVCTLADPKGVLNADLSWIDEVCTLADPKGVLNADLSWIDEVCELKEIKREITASWGSPLCILEPSQYEVRMEWVNGYCQQT